jgi:hypothetical protein
LRDIKEEDCSYPTLEVEGHPKMEDQKWFSFYPHRLPNAIREPYFNTGVFWSTQNANTKNRTKATEKSRTVQKYSPRILTSIGKDGSIHCVSLWVTFHDLSRYQENGYGVPILSGNFRDIKMNHICAYCSSIIDCFCTSFANCTTEQDLSFACILYMCDTCFDEASDTSSDDEEEPLIFE